MITKRFLYTDKLKTLIFDEADETLSVVFKETIYNIVKTVIPYLKYVCLVQQFHLILKLSTNF